MHHFVHQELCEPQESVQVATRMDRGLGRLRELELFRLEKRRQKTDGLRLFIYLKGRCKEKGNHLFLVGRVRCNGLKLHQGGKAFLMVTLVRHSFISQSVMVSLLRDVFKYVLDKY